MAVRFIMIAAIVAGVLSVGWLYGWHEGYDTGYKTAMADSFLGIKTAEQYFQELIDAGRGVSH